MKLANLLLLILFGPLVLAATPEDMQSVNLRVAQEQVLPGYRHFHEKAERFRDTLGDFCSSPDEHGMSKAREGFAQLLAAWMGAEHWQFGAIEFGLRRERIWFWPDKRGRSGRQLSAALAEADPKLLAQDAFAYASVAVQGLTAAERLLYENETLEAIASQPYRCLLLKAIAGNMVHLSGEILTDWQRAGDGDLAAIQGAEQDNDIYPEPAAVTARLLASLRNPLVRIHQLKLAAPMGESATGARPKRAESWRSGLGIANLRSNFAALAALYGEQPDQGLRSLLGERHAPLDREIVTAFEEIRKDLDKLPDDAFADPAQRPALEALLARVQSLEQTVEKSLPAALDIPLGFNSLDGD
ncbi:MAG: imelysin family protein [Chromatiales bacterium]|nr:imelysin family protein [Chromatiales bacterium]